MLHYATTRADLLYVLTTLKWFSLSVSQNAILVINTNLFSIYLTHFLHVTIAIAWLLLLLGNNKLLSLVTLVNRCVSHAADCAWILKQLIITSHARSKPHMPFASYQKPDFHDVFNAFR